MKILLVEDNQILSQALKDKMEQEGLNADAAFNGQEGWDMLQKDEYSLIVLDIIMPIMNGFELLEKIKADDRFKKIPVMIASNLGQDEEIKKGKDLGANAYFIKSNIQLNDLIEKIKEMLPN